MLTLRRVSSSWIQISDSSKFTVHTCTSMYRYKYKHTTFAAVGGTLGDQRCRMMGHGARLNFIHHES